MLSTDSSSHRHSRLTMVSLTVHHKLPIPGIRKYFKGTTPPRDSSPGSCDTTLAAIERLPSAVISQIARHSTTKETLYLSLCSKRLRSALAPSLYACVDLINNRQCKSALIALSKQPENAAHVRRLRVRPNCFEWTIPGEEIDEGLLSALIVQLAPSLRSLESFGWDGLELPQDDLWVALRTSCKNLKRISTSIGEAPLLANSHLFNFDDLRQLSVVVRSRSLEWLAEGVPKPEKLPRRFWAMLIERCPRLEELTLGGPSPSPRIFDVRHVTAGRWPRLRTMEIGDAVLISSNKGEEQSRKDWEAFMAFFAWHSSLTAIHLKHAPGSAHLPSGFVLPPTALPRLESFSGPLKFVKTLPHANQLRNLSLTCLHHVSSSLPPTFALVQELPLLKSLSIWIDLSFNLVGKVSTSTSHHPSIQVEDMHVVRSLLAACSRSLTHLDLLCFTRPTFSMKDFSSAISVAPNLRSFTLTKLFRSGDEDMTRCATRVMHDNPHLQRFSIRQTHDSWFSHGGGRIKQSARFEVLEDGTFCGDRPQPLQPHNGVVGPDIFGSAIGARNKTVNLLVYECGRGGLTGREYSKTFVHSVDLLSKDTDSVKRKESRRSRRRSELSTTSTSSWSGWSWGTAAEQTSSSRSSISSEQRSLFNKSPLSRHTSLKYVDEYVLV